MNLIPNTQPMTLENIARQKEEVRKQILVQKEVMGDLVHELFAPMKPPASKAEGMMQAFNTGMAMFEGARLGMKIIRRVKGFFRK